MHSLVSSPSLKEFFKSQVEDTTRRQRVRLSEMTRCYLVDLLSEFACSDKLYAQVEGRKQDEPLAVLFHRAQQQEREERIRTLRRLGDVSLYKAGFFASALRKGLVGHDYYIQMGGSAYGQVASLSAARGFGGVYQELGGKFRTVVAVLEEIAARSLVQSGAAGTLKVYESWVRTGNSRLKQVLVEAGLVVPRGLVN